MASKAPIHVMITGAAGQIGYALAPMVARGAMLGPDQPVVLHLLDIEPAAQALEGVKMELMDAAFPLLRGAYLLKMLERYVISTCLLSLAGGRCSPALCTHAHACYCGNVGVVASTNVEEVCKGVDVAVMLGGFPRKAGMERKDVMGKNVSIYAAQAAALEKHANKGVKVSSTKVTNTSSTHFQASFA